MEEINGVLGKKFQIWGGWVSNLENLEGEGGPLPSPRTVAAALFSRPSKEGAPISIHLMQVQ